MYEYDKEAKKVKAPDGKLLSGGEVLDHLNHLFTGMANMHYAWQVLSEGVSIMDSVFLGASVPNPEVPDEVANPEPQVEGETPALEVIEGGKEE